MKSVLQVLSVALIITACGIGDPPVDIDRRRDKIQSLESHPVLSKLLLAVACNPTNRSVTSEVFEANVMRRVPGSSTSRYRARIRLLVNSVTGLFAASSEGYYGSSIYRQNFASTDYTLQNNVLSITGFGSVRIASDGASMSVGLLDTAEPVLLVRSSTPLNTAEHGLSFEAFCVE